LINVTFRLLSHSASLMKTFDVQLNAVPRAGELIVTDDELDNTNEFIVLDIKHFVSKNIIEIDCESFYSSGGMSRQFHLTHSGWLNNCSDESE